MKIQVFSVAALALGFGLAGTAAADVDAIAATCVNCHGEGGVSQDNAVPTIAGLSEFYHADQLYFYRDGDRTCEDADGETMCAAVANLSDDDVKALVNYYASQQ